MMKKIILILITIGLVLPIFSFAQISAKPIEEKAPGILAGWWNSIKAFFWKVKDIFWGALIKAWQEALSLWRKMWLWIKNMWRLYFGPKIDPFTEKIKAKFRW